MKESDIDNKGSDINRLMQYPLPPDEMYPGRNGLPPEDNNGWIEFSVPRSEAISMGLDTTELRWRIKK